MRFDVFFSVSQTPVRGVLPSEAQMFRNLLHQAEAADALGYEVAWLAESHLSSEVQKRHRQPVIPHWEGEVGLNVDFVQTATAILARTSRLEVGSAILNLLCNGGPIAAAERLAACLTLHGLDPEERRRLHVGFAAGRFDFMNRAYGIVPRTPVEEAAGRAWKGRLFREAGEIFVRLLRGDVLSSNDLPRPWLERAHFPSDAAWAAVQEAHGQAVERVPLDPWWTFEPLQIVPRDWRRELLQLVVGSHDPEVQSHLNTFAPVRVFNLSITQPEVIEATHARMARDYHPGGGPWRRSHMPRTTFVFLNELPGLTPEQRRAAAQEEAREALGAYWRALEGTLDPSKVERAAQNALIGNAEDVATQCLERFHPEDRLMLWFDFFNHDSDRVVANMEAFMTEVRPRIEARIEARLGGH